MCVMLLFDGRRGLVFEFFFFFFFFWFFFLDIVYGDEIGEEGGSGLTFWRVAVLNAWGFG